MAAPVIYRTIRVSDDGTNGNTLTIGEPSAAVLGDQIFATGNVYAARSNDGGATWTHIDPGTFLMPQPPTPFCCDQTVVHVPSHDIVVWVMQYDFVETGNTMRIAVNRGATLDDGDWVWWDLTPVDIDPTLTDEWFDYNHAAISDNFLYVGTNMFKTSPRGNEPWTRSIVFRFPLTELQAGGNLSFDYLESTTHASVRCTAGATSTMFVVGQNPDMKSLHVWEWPENAAATEADVDVSPWTNFRFVSDCPDGTHWLGRCDDRITGSWVANGRIGIAWASNEIQPRRPHPFIRVVVLDEATLTVVAEPDIWNASYAFAYPDTWPNDAGVVGITMFRGGGGVRNPGHVVGQLQDTPLRWFLRRVIDGTNGPRDGTWGDYIHCRRSAPDGMRWIATGFTLQGGQRAANVVQHIVEYGS